MNILKNHIHINDILDIVRNYNINDDEIKNNKIECIKSMNDDFDFFYAGDIDSETVGLYMYYLKTNMEGRKLINASLDITYPRQLHITQNLHKTLQKLNNNMVCFYESFNGMFNANNVLINTYKNIIERGGVNEDYFYTITGNQRCKRYRDAMDNIKKLYYENKKR